MKKLFTPLLIFTTCLLYAQIPNAGFESWTSPNQPAGWSTSNGSYQDTSVTQSLNAYTGTYAMRINSISIEGLETLGGIVTAGDSAGDANGFPLGGGPPAALHGWYVANLIGLDELLATIEVLGGGNTGGIGSGAITTSTSVYKEFVFNIDYPVGLGGDSGYITFQMLNDSGQTHLGSYIILDDLSYGAATAINDVNQAATLESCYPNPADNVTNIFYSINESGSVSLSLYDILGNKVKALLSNEKQGEGRYKVPVNVSDLPSGIYISSLTVNGQLYTQKVIVNR